MIECSAARIVSRAAARPAIGSREAAGPTRCAKTPNGIDRADSVPATQCTGVVSDWVTARARVVLPTPASPNSTMPEKSIPPANAERIAPNSSSRRTIGQDRVSTSRDSTANPDEGSGLAVLVPAFRRLVIDYEETA